MNFLGLSFYVENRDFIDSMEYLMSLDNYEDLLQNEKVFVSLCAKLGLDVCMEHGFWKGVLFILCSTGNYSSKEVFSWFSKILIDGQIKDVPEEVLLKLYESLDEKVLKVSRQVQPNGTMRDKLDCEYLILAMKRSYKRLAEKMFADLSKNDIKLLRDTHVLLLAIRLEMVDVVRTLIRNSSMRITHIDEMIMAVLPTENKEIFNILIDYIDTGNYRPSPFSFKDIIKEGKNTLIFSILDRIDISISYRLLDHCCYHNNFDVFNHLLNKAMARFNHVMVDIDLKKEMNGTFLRCFRTACQKGHLDILKMLISYGVQELAMKDISGNHKDYMTMAVFSGSYEMVKLLLEKTDIDPCYNGNDALKVAQSQNRTDIEELLLSIPDVARLAKVDTFIKILEEASDKAQVSSLD